MPSTGRGATVWITGLPAAGKSTVARATAALLSSLAVEALVLDGDELRAAMSTPLGFSREDRARAVAGAGELALSHAAAGIVAVTALVSPYRDDRELVRRRHEEAGAGFLEVWLRTPIEVCIERDPKQLYARALRGEIRQMTGIDDPYERPLRPELALGPELSPEAAAARIAALLDLLVG
jgi:bifunctional enzyme CysN/CysC